MSTPAPINAVRTRVIRALGGFVAQASTDGLNWFCIDWPPFHEIEPATLICQKLMAGSETLSPVGVVVWTSEGGPQ